MRTSQLVTSYIQAVIFAAIGAKSVMAWLREREQRSAHLAIATGLFAVSSFIGAISATLWDTGKGEVAPRALTITSSIVLFLSLYAFLLFLSDFVHFRPWAHVLSGFATVSNIVLAFIERPDLRFDPQKGIVAIPGIHNPISFRAYIGYVLLYLAAAFGILFVAFFIYGLRVAGRARTRMLLIGGGFFLIFAVIGLIPRLLFGNPTAETIRQVSTAAQYVALLAGPLLYLGFTPPDRFKRRASGDRPQTGETYVRMAS